MKQRIVSIFLCLALILALVPVTALAATDQDYTLVLLEGLVYKNGYGPGEDIPYPGITGQKLEENHYQYTLENLNFSTESETAVLILDDNATLELKGQNTLCSGQMEDEDSRALDTVGNLVIQGSGSLEVTGGPTSGNGETASYGIYVSGTLTVKSGTITATGGTSPFGSIGLYADGNLTIQGGTVKGQGGKADLASVGIGSLQEVIVEDGIVNAYGGISASSCGILSLEFTMENGNLTADGTPGLAGYGIAYGGMEELGIRIYGGNAILQGSAQASCWLKNQIPYASAPVTKPQLGQNAMTVRASDQADGSDAVPVLNWVGDGSDDVSAYRYMHLAPVVVLPISNPFKDVKESHWFYEDVMFVYANGLMNGMSADTFDPAFTTNRAMVVTILYRLEGEPAVSGSNAFRDVPQGQWFTKAIAWATEEGIVTGYDSSQFGPMDPVTREQMATILYRYAQYRGLDVSSGKTADLGKFADGAKVQSWAKDAMKWAVAEGIIGGRPGGILDPQGKAQRCEVAAILHRFCDGFHLL